MPVEVATRGTVVNEVVMGDGLPMVTGPKPSRQAMMRTEMPHKCLLFSLYIARGIW